MGTLLLGLPGPWADDHREPSDHYTTKIGGLPDWPFPKEGLDPSLLKCSVCGNKHCLIAQVYAPVSTETSQIEERFVVVLGCVTPECGGNNLSWRALRIQKAEDAGVSSSTVALEESPSTPGAVPPSEVSWWDNLEDEEGEDIDLEDLSEAFSVAASLTPEPKKLNSSKHSGTASKPSPLKQPKAAADVDTPAMPCFYIYTREESLSTNVASAYSSNSLPDINEKENNEGHEEPWAPEAYEYDKALTADRTFLKFKKQLDASPDQCFRYAFGGKPLLATMEVKEPGNCRRCGASRHFEMQLMPPTIYFLQEESEDYHKCSIDNWNWMTLVVYTCSKSCSISGNEEKPKTGGWIVAEETIIAQTEKTLEECSTEYFK